MPGWHRDGSVIDARIAGNREQLARLPRLLRYRRRVLQKIDVGLIEPCAVDVHALVLQLDGFARQPDDALDEIALRILRILEHDHVLALDRLHREHRALGPGDGRAEHELVHQQMIADQQVLLHRPGRYLERLDDERADEERQHDGDNERLEVLAPN